MAEEDEETIMEEREALMISRKGGNPSLRMAYFLKPTIKNLILDLDTLPSLPISTRPKSPLKVNVSFNGWTQPQREWKSWYDQMHTDHQSLWVKAGIDQALTASTYKFHKDTALILGLAATWCPEIKTFVFPWGEATVTLEDIMMLGGFSVLGDPVSKQLDTPESLQAKQELIKQRKSLFKTPARSSRQWGWKKLMMGSGSALEHEAFLALWLSRFVVPSNSAKHFGESVFPIAIHLAKGTQIALAPAVLASIYRDLGLIKEAMLANNTRKKEAINLGVNAPFQLLQLWAWERLPMLQPIPNSINPGEPRSAKWNNVKPLAIVCEKEALELIDSGKETFKWRPYTIYKGKEGWVSLDSDLEDEELSSLLRCLRPSELVGLDCVEQYLPHRVSMQFGMDQDLPGNVPRSNGNKELAWKSYSQPICYGGLYIPSLQFEPGVTSRYSDWWEDASSLKGSTPSLRKHTSEKKQGSCSVLAPNSKTGKRLLQSTAKDGSRSTLPPKTCKRNMKSIANHDQPSSKAHSKTTKLSKKESLATEEASQKIAPSGNTREVLLHDEPAKEASRKETRNANGDVTSVICEDEVVLENAAAAAAAEGPPGKEKRDKSEVLGKNSIGNDQATSMGSREVNRDGVVNPYVNTVVKNNEAADKLLYKEAKRDETRDSGENSNANAVGINEYEGESSSLKVGIRKLPIEDRISNLEKVFAALKAAKFSNV